jgi:hypothetical protein
MILVLATTLCSVWLGAQARTNKVEAVYSDSLPTAAPVGSTAISVHGILFGQPFVADEALINSYSLILRQKHKTYARVVLNFSAFGRPLAGQECFSRGASQPRIEAYQRLKNGGKLRSQVFGPGDGYALHMKFEPRNKVLGSDTTPGAIILRFENGDYVTGTFVARRSPRVIWDDEGIAD